MRDQFGREIDYLRLALTDRCNFRCRYCVGSGMSGCLSQEEMLTDEELVRLVECCAGLGIKKLKLTGGEPLLRPNLPQLVERFIAVEGIEDVTLTTNGYQLPKLAFPLRRAGISGVNISLDTLDREEFQHLTGVDGLEQVFSGIQAAGLAGFDRVKVNCVTGQHLVKSAPEKIAVLAKEGPIWVRYIESMPLGEGKQFPAITRAELKDRLETMWGKMTSVDVHGNGPAEYYHIEGFQGLIGLISPVTQPFCSRCNRIRITPEGMVKPCLQYAPVLDLRSMLREGASNQELTEALSGALFLKPRAHQFDRPQTGAAIEARNMSAIGG